MWAGSKSAFAIYLMAERHRGECCLIRHDPVSDVEQTEPSRDYPQFCASIGHCCECTAPVLSGIQTASSNVFIFITRLDQYFPPGSISCGGILCARENRITCRHAFAPGAGDDKMGSAGHAGPAQGFSTGALPSNASLPES